MLLILIKINYLKKEYINGETKMHDGYAYILLKFPSVVH